MPGRNAIVLALVAFAAACSAEPDSEAAASPASAAPQDDRIDCALRGAAAFARECTIERAPQGGVLYLVVRHPDGAFRRFKVLEDGRGVAVADGAEEAVTSIADGLLEVTVEKDRYRFPATEKRHEPTS